MSDADVQSSEAGRVTASVFADDESSLQWPKDRLDRTIEVLERVMPDLPMLGALMLLLVVYLAASGSDFGASQECFDALRDAQSAAAQASAIAPF